LEAHQSEIVPCGESRRARTDDGDTFSSGLGEVGVGEKLKQMARACFINRFGLTPDTYG